MGKSKKEQPSFKAINWDFNQDNIEFYDVMPYIIRCWEREKENRKKKLKNLKRHKNRDYEAEKACEKMPETFEEIKKFILDEALYQFWGRCEYEVIVTGWPVSKREYKLDVYEQVKKNIDIITKSFMDYINS